MRDEGDMQGGQDMTLTGRIGRIERFLGECGMDTGMFGVVGQRDVDERDYGLEKHIERAGQSPSPTAFEEIINRIQASTDRVFRQAGKIEEIGARIMGPLPEAANGKGDACCKPDGTLDQTFMVLDYLDTGLQRLEAAVTRLERV